MRCQACPVPTGVECASADHPRFCFLAATRPDYLPVILELSTGDRPDPASSSIDPPTPTLSADIAATFAIRRCPVREPSGYG